VKKCGCVRNTTPSSRSLLPRNRELRLGVAGDEARLLIVVGEVGVRSAWPEARLTGAYGAPHGGMVSVPTAVTLVGEWTPGVDVVRVAAEGAWADGAEWVTKGHEGVVGPVGRWSPSSI
jgi:hypothetical protein